MGEAAPNPVRVFLAIELSDAVRDELTRAQRPLKALPVRVSWVRPENLHLTVLFLGEIVPSRVATVATILDDACAAHPPFSFEVTGLGTFGSPRRPRVIWAGVPDPPDALRGLQQALRTDLRVAGIDVEIRAFRPHLTLGRVRGPQGEPQLTSAVASANNTRFGEVSVQRVQVMQSQLDASGARYAILRESGLKGS